MSTTAATSNNLRTFVKWAAITLILTVTTWTIVITWWQATRRVVTAADAIIYLVALPCALMACIGLFKWRSIRKKRSTDRAMAVATASASEFAHAGKSEPPLTLPIVNAWAVTGAASSASDFIEIVSERRSRPQPDPCLTDDDGFPILSARTDDLDTSRVERFIAETLAAGTLDQAPTLDCWRGALIRALALLEFVVDQFSQDCFEMLLAASRPSATQADTAITLRGTPAAHPAVAKFHLHVKLLVPTRFLSYERQFALLYLAKLMPLPQAPALHLELVSSDDDALAFALADKFSRHSASDASPKALLLLACDSMLCSTIIEDWQACARLFSAGNPNGLMAGEAAIGVFCANDAALASMSTGAACHLHRLSMRQRELPADAPGKPSHACLDDVVHDALGYAGITPDTIGTVACDTDHRTGRVLECIGTMMNHTPQLDAIENRLAVNEVCGHLGAASVPALLAAGVLQATQAEHPVLLFNVSHATERAAAVLVPAFGS